ncbi:MAG: hypothetical protein AAF597_02900 [Bacteroidota bacterium]
MELFYTIAGWVGAFGLLIAFCLSSLGKMDSQGTPYHLINLFCSVLLIVNATANAAYPFIVINSFWSMMSAYAIGKNLLGQQSTA